MRLKRYGQYMKVSEPLEPDPEFDSFMKSISEELEERRIEHEKRVMGKFEEIDEWMNAPRDKSWIHEESPPVTVTYDVVNHPAHYTTGKIETIDFIEDKELGYHLGNVVKYVVRAGKKDRDAEVQDLEKAQWYLARKIEGLKNGSIK